MSAYAPNDAPKVEKLMTTCSMVDVIGFALVVYSFVCLVTCIHILNNKNRFFKKTFHIIGNPKKFIILQDKRLIPTLWKQYIWKTWASNSALYTYFGILFIIFDLMDYEFMIFDSNFLDYERGAGLVSIGIAATAIFIIPLRKSKAYFYKLKDNLGVELKRDEEAVKTIMGKTARVDRLKFKIIVVVNTVSSTVFFAAGNMFLGTLIAISAIYSIIKLIELKKYL